MAACSCRFGPGADIPLAVHTLTDPAPLHQHVLRPDIPPTYSSPHLSARPHSWLLPRRHDPLPPPRPLPLHLSKTRPPSPLSPGEGSTSQVPRRGFLRRYTGHRWRDRGRLDSVAARMAQSLALGGSLGRPGTALVEPRVLARVLGRSCCDQRRRLGAPAREGEEVSSLGRHHRAQSQPGRRIWLKRFERHQELDCVIEQDVDGRRLGTGVELATSGQRHPGLRLAGRLDLLEDDGSSPDPQLERAAQVLPRPRCADVHSGHPLRRQSPSLLALLLGRDS